MLGPLPGSARLCLVAPAALWVAAVACAPPPESDPGPDAATPPGGPVPVAVDPPLGAEGVPRDKVIRVTFDDHLDSRTLSPGDLDIHSGPLSRWAMCYYDPVRRQLVTWPSTWMLANATWVLSLEYGIKGLDGQPVAPGDVAVFRTGETGGDNTPFTPPSFPDRVLPLLERRCASCHGPSRALEGLRLDGQEGIAASAVNTPAKGWQGWRRIVPTRPGDSYLLFKIIGDERISGMAMPRDPDLDRPGPPLEEAEQELLSDWIASGASFFDPPDAGE